MNFEWTTDRLCNQVMENLKELFFGPPKGGVYSPSVQYTLYQMAWGGGRG